ncbi:membrane-associated tyrosine- and threonine-specific cdc2-inhibitory kinase [Lates japonicus]|uniref:Membrane-associated tyrosine- and threonine-specific cdc2-inhibitory kinase n=1 Tax=Lates japonicus TaxID=270547 RepID=A0AAD3NK54_LATJO|nr:membrane-associated tyrosine- and threonine-specific cdc2-inhibitory kinase [Lates japonicus]
MSLSPCRLVHLILFPRPSLILSPHCHHQGVSPLSRMFPSIQSPGHPVLLFIMSMFYHSWCIYGPVNRLQAVLQMMLAPGPLRPTVSELLALPAVKKHRWKRRIYLINALRDFNADTGLPLPGPHSQAQCNNWSHIGGGVLTNLRPKNLLQPVGQKQP